MKVLSRMDSDTEKVNGHKIKLNTSEITYKGSNRDMESFIFQVVIFTKEISSTIEDKAMVKCFGLMDLFTKVNGNTGFKMARDKFT